MAASRNNKPLTDREIVVKAGDAFLIRGIWNDIEQLKVHHENLVIIGSPEGMSKTVTNITYNSVSFSPAGRRGFGRGFGAIHGCDGSRLRDRHRCAANDKPSRCRDLFQAGGEERYQTCDHGSARPGPVAPCRAFVAVQARY